MFAWKLVCEIRSMYIAKEIIFVLILVCVEVSMWGDMQIRRRRPEYPVLILVCVEVSMWDNMEWSNILSQTYVS